MHTYGRRSAPISQGLVYDINTPHAFGVRQSKPNAIHTYGRGSPPITQGLVSDINTPHVFGLRDSKPNVMVDYGRNSTLMTQGLVYDINSPHALGLRESKRTYGTVHTPISQGLVAIINAQDQKLWCLQKPKDFWTTHIMVKNTSWRPAHLTGWSGEKRRSDRTLVPRSRKRRFWMRQITQRYLSPPRKTIPVGGFPPLRPKFHTTIVTPTKMECSVMIIIDKGPNKGLLFEPNTGSNLGHPVGFLFCPEF